MINAKYGGLLNVQEGIVMHDCNVLGVMGAGVALSLRTLYLGAFDVYRRHFEKDGLSVEVSVYKTSETGALR